MEKVYTLGKMEENTKVCINKTRNMEWVYILIRMEVNTVGSGRTVFSMDKVV